MNNMGSTTLLHPVFNSLEQLIIFGRVDYLFFYFYNNIVTTLLWEETGAPGENYTFCRALTDFFHMVGQHWES